MNNSYTIKDLIALFLSKLWLIVIVTILGGVVAYCYSRFMLPLEYSSHISMYVQSYTVKEDSEQQQVNNISNSKQLINTYIQVLKDDAVMEAVSDRLENSYPREILAQNFVMQGDNITPSSLRSCITISSVSDTSALNIYTTTRNPEVAAAVCNNLAAVANHYIQEAVAVGSISSIDTAKVYYSPVAPNTPKNTLMGLAAGFMLIILIILVIDFFDNTIKETDSLSTRYNKAIIGEIPRFGHTGKKKKKHHDRAALKLTDKDIPFGIVESYKSIRTNITFSLSTSDKRIFAVSSPNPGEGKSTTATNIAIAIAQSGRKVLLIDADLRKSVIHRMFGAKNEFGLSTVTSKQAELEECIQHTDVENLDVITAGEVPPNPSELLGSKRMAKILDELSEQYSTIIIDTPPVNVVTDAMELAKYVSGIVMVMRYGKTTTEDLEAAMKKIDFSQMHVLGFVLNDVDTKHHGKYYAKYKGGYYYSYYGKEKKDPAPTNKG